MGRAGNGGYLSAAVRAEWRLVAAGEGTENDGGMGRDVARLDSARHGGDGARDGARDGALGETKGVVGGKGGVGLARRQRERTGDGLRDEGGGTEAGRLRLRATTLPTVSRYGWPRSDGCRAFLASFLANYHQ